MIGVRPFDRLALSLLVICGNGCLVHIATFYKIEIFTTILVVVGSTFHLFGFSLSLYAQERADRETTEETLLKLLEAGTCRKL